MSFLVVSLNYPYWLNPHVKCIYNTSPVFSGVVGFHFAVAQAYQAVFGQCAVLFMEHGDSFQEDPRGCEVS